MSKLKISLLFLVMLVVPLANSALVQAQAEEKTWRINKEDAKCFFENLPKYAKAAEEPIVVFLKACPIVDRTAAIAKLQQNSQLPKIKETPANTFDEVLVFNRQEILCLQTSSYDLTGPEVQIPAKPACDK